ncbi:MAG: sulfatase [Planctomycetota bacterium JB042]
MPPRRPLRSLGLALAAAVAACSEPAVDRPTNVLLLVVDTLRADRLGVYGSSRPTSPRLDALAARGTLYESAYTQGTWTGPAMLSLMTGLYVSDEEERLPADRPVLAERLREAGLATAAFVGNPVLAHDRGFDRGFDHFDAPIRGGRTSTVVERFADWHARWRSATGASERGFFAWLHATDPHTPYAPPARFRRFDGRPRADEEALRERWSRFESPVAFEPEAARTATLDEAAASIRDQSNLYDAEVLTMDAAVGALIDLLEERGELDRTLIVVASDHGEELYEHLRYPEDLRVWIRQSPTGMGLGIEDLLERAHGSCFHDEVWRVPLILAGPGFPAGARRGGLAANLDLVPTILAALGRPVPPDVHGESLLGGRAPARRQVFGYSRRAAAVVDDRGFKFVDRRRKRELYPDWATGPEDRGTLEQLFDLARDPGELVDVRDARPRVAGALEAAIDRWFAETARDVDRRLSDEDRDALRELGYLDGR